jgi:hypothetical protein
MHLKAAAVSACLLLSALIGPPLARAQVSPVDSTFLLWSAPARGSSVAFDSTNRVYFAVSAHGTLYGRFFTEDGVLLGEPIVIEEFPGFAQFPHVAYSPEAGAFLVTWYSGAARSRLVSYTGGFLGGEQVLSPGDIVYEIMGAPVAYSATSREFLVAWRSGLSFDIEVRRVGLNGIPVSPAFPITSGVVFRNNPSIAYNPAQNEFMVLYAEGFPVASAVVQRVRAGAEPPTALVGGPVIVGQAASIFTTGITYNRSTGQYLAAWHQSPPDAIYGRVVSATGAPTGDVVALSTRYGTYDSLAVSANPVSGTVLMVGHDKLNFEDGGVEVGPTGVPLGAGFQVTFSGTTGGNFHPRAASHTSRPEWTVVASSGFTRTIAQRLRTATPNTGTPPPPAQLRVAIAANVATPIPQGYPITWTATSTGGSGTIQYKFVRFTTGVGWTVAQDYGAGNSYTWFPGAGTHAVQVWARAVGSTAQYQAYAGTDLFTVTPPLATLSSLTASTSFPTTLGTAVTWTAAASAGSVPVQYQFWRFSSSTGWVLGQDYSTSRTFTWFPPAGTNAVQVWARAAGSTAIYQDWRSSGLFTVTSAAGSPARLTGLTGNFHQTASPQSLITFTATGAGGTGALEYKFFLWNATTGAWTILRDWSAANQASWIPGTSGTGRHAVQVWVRSAGSTALYEDWRSSNVFNITDLATVSLLASTPLTAVSAGQPVTFTASVTGGPGPWEFAFISYNGATWTLRQAYTANANTFTMSFPAGTAALQVWVRAAGSGTAWEAYTGTGVFTVR